MGALFSRVRLIYQTLKSISDSFSALSKRISRDPGLPTPAPSRSYWCLPHSPLDNLETSSLPADADVVIIGSGIAGAAIARTLLDSSSGGKKRPLRIAMLEARDICSGATGRNGGHISPNSYQDYSELASKYGVEAAQAMIRFRLAHLPALLAVAEEEGLLPESQARMVDQFDIYLRETLFQRAKNSLAAYFEALPERREKHDIRDAKAKIEDLQLSPLATGCISQSGGALHPYRLITGILARLLNVYPAFQLFTHTPCTDIALAADGRSYCIITPKGTLTTAHVIHATNAWAAHLLPGMRRKIVPMRVHMTAQRPGSALGVETADALPWTGTRAFVFYPGTTMFAFDYLTQQPNGDGLDADNSAKLGSDVSADTGYPAPAGELMFGGGAMLGGRAEAVLLDNIGIADDSGTDFEVTAYLGGALERYFAPGWGEESSTSSSRAARTAGGSVSPSGDDGWGAGRIKAAWTGIMGLSADGQPWVGRVPRYASQRAEPGEPPTPEANLSLARPGEWIAAGFSGEGMTHAWLAGVALARMVLVDVSVKGKDASALPPQFLITEKRLKEADIEAFLGEVGSE
ncbi:nucleotide-binding domain-containing protein [Mycena alexandri]|uniref:Nucleotide-binding domain-containing protein n=1 Tax=Mycena alexandri TaxID=1745969 RepID=A0AAD6WNR3_9AGAR|nr:nucleotide-binding domain-containing protein [Mycena alexandri]